MSSKRVSIKSAKAAEASSASSSQSSATKQKSTEKRKAKDTGGKPSKVAKSKALASSKPKVSVSDSDSDDSAVSSSIEEDVDQSVMVADNLAAIEASRLKNKADQDAKLEALLLAKEANVEDDGMVSIAELKAALGETDPLRDADEHVEFPAILSTSDALKLSATLIAARPHVAIFDGAAAVKVAILSGGSLGFIVSMTEVRVGPPDALVIKNKLVVNVYQFLHPPDKRTSARLVVRVATNEAAPQITANKQLLSRSEAFTLTLDNRDDIYRVSQTGWKYIGSLPDFRRAGVIGEISWSEIDESDKGDPDEDIPEKDDEDPRDDGENFVSKTLISPSLANNRQAATNLTEQSGLVLEDLTTPTAGQISFGRPSQYWLTADSAIAASKRAAAKKKVLKPDSESSIGDYGKSNSLRFSALGMNSKIAAVVSCAPYDTITTDIHEGWGRIKDRLGVPACIAIYRQVLISWCVPIQSGAILYFVALNEHHGARAAELLLRNFDGFTDEKLPLDPGFVSLWEQMRLPIANISLDTLQRATERFMLMIFSAWDVRFVLQAEMLRSSDRLFSYLRNNSLSSSNASMVTFTIAAIFELMKRWETFRSSCTRVEKSGLRDIVERYGPPIPDLSLASTIGQMFHNTAFMDGSSLIKTLFQNAGMVQASVTTPVQNLSQVSANKVDKLSQKANKKAKKEAKKAADAANSSKNLATSSSSSSNATMTAASGTSALSTGVVVPDCCVYYHSTKGCRKSDNCTFDHGSPPLKGSPAWTQCSKLLAKIGLTPTAAFQQ